MQTKTLSVENAVRRRYSKGARRKVAALCCPVAGYNTDYLKVIPAEVIERDYGCGDPSKHLRDGETVLDLGSGAGKICFIAAQVVGPHGRVIGVDMNDDMLALARKHQPAVARRLGYNNVEFRKGRIQDLALDHDRLDAWLRKNPVGDSAGFARLNAHIRQLKTAHPMIADGAVDVVVSNCVLNLVENAEKRQLFAEIFRVLKRGGRAVISDIVSDEDVPCAMQNDPALWSGCISGAFREDSFLRAFEDAGFYGIRILERGDKPWRTVRGIEFRAMTVEAFKGKQGACLERNQAMIYKGPFREVVDDDGHRIRRGERFAVCDKTFGIYSREPYATHFQPVPPRREIPLSRAKPWSYAHPPLRHPRETKGHTYRATTDGNGNGSASTRGPSCC